MITVYNAMLVTLGFLLAALAVLFVMPAYRRRVERFATERLKRALPITEAEIRADKDRIRAEYATAIHKLEVKLEDASLSAARQSVEINRREAKINDLMLEVEAKKASVEENENARRVLEQAIMDRLPKVEQRLLEARNMLQQRDDEIARLANSAGKQGEALEQATQINAQLSGEVNRLKSALETRAARNRDSIADARFDSEIALKSELETLRAKSREQAQLIERLQESGAAGASAEDKSAGQSEIEKLKGMLAKAEAELEAAKGSGGAATGSDDKLRQLQEENRAHVSAIARLKAALEVHEVAANAPAVGGDDVALRAEIKAMQADVEAKERTIERLKAEIASGNERLARQAEHFRDEVRRLSAGTQNGNDERRARTIDAARRSLAARISEPRVPRAEAATDEGSAETPAPSEARPAAYLRAVNGGAASKENAVAADVATAASSAQESIAAPRRSRLLDRISNIDKSS